MVTATAHLLTVRIQFMSDKEAYKAPLPTIILSTSHSHLCGVYQDEPTSTLLWPHTLFGLFHMVTGWNHSK
jgi:hypothetical protein